MTNFTKAELIHFNEILLGRGMPTQQDGIGYNKADYGACRTYFYGLSDAQFADLAKRLVKYTETQLKVCKDTMKQTAKDLAEIANDGDRSDGISLNITDKGTLISFRYNETFIEKIKEQPVRRYDGENKNWIIPNGNVIKALESLREVGADVDNAIEYAKNHDAMNAKEEKAEVLVKYKDDKAFLKFRYNKEILDEIKKINIQDREWNAEFKFWAISKILLDKLKESLKDIAVFKQA